MYNYYRNANFHLLFFLRQRFWPFLFPSIAILFLIFCPQLSQSILINHNEQTENPDRTVAKLGPRDIQLTTTLAPLSIVPSTANFNNFIHTLYVISLDGKITAIDAGANGRQLWTADTGSPLVDSSLSKIEISRDSQSVRLIPSLIGGLYEKYDEDGHVEPLPFDADALLDASFKLHDDVVITGGKHIDTLGLDLHTGQILYSFSNDNSKQKNTTTTTNSDNNDSRDTLVVKRTTQTVRARSPRNGYEKWNFSVSNHDLFHLQTQPPTVIINQFNSNHQFEEKTKIFDHFEYQLQTGAVLAFDKSDNLLWSSAINAPIAAVWELKNGELHEKSLFETNKKSANENSEEEEQSSSPPISHRLAFVGEFNSTPYVLISPRVQKQLIYETRKNNQVAGPIGAKRPVLSSWHKAYQKRTLSIGSELPENNHPRAIGASTSDSHYPLALRPDPAGNHQTHTPTIVETCDTAGYLELITNPNDNFITENLEQNNLPLLVNQNTHSNIYIPSNTFTISSVFLGAIIVIWIWYRKQKQIEYSRQKSLTSEASDTVTITPPSTPEYHQLEQPLTPPFQSRYTLEYEHVCFLGRGGFGVVFEAINKLDERRVAIKRVSLKKASGKDRALKEIRYLAVLNHPNLIQYYYAWNESPPMAWQDEQDKLLLVRNNVNTRDSMSTFPTSANDSESNNQIKSSVSNQKLSPSSHSPLFEITFDRSQNPLLINEDFSADDQKSQIISATSSSSSSFDNRLDANNNSKKSSSSSPLFDHSLDSSHEKHSLNREKSESDDDDGIVFLHDEKDSSSSSPPPISIAEAKCLIEKKRLLDNDKDISPVYFYFVMELCQPESLRDRLTKRMIDRPQAWLIFDQIIKGIEYIHSKKLIHRDLKPSNILFSLDGTVKIGDFGLVSAFGEDKLAKKVKREDEKSDHFDITSSTTDPCGNDELGGTMLYMSPEQINRQPYNQKVDIYAMGIILFELLYPFSTQMERMQSIANVRLQTPVFPNDFERDGNNRNQLICRLIRWLLSHSPRDRPRASELRQDTFYQRMLQLEVPQLCCSDNRQQNQTIVSGQDQTPICHQRTRVPSSSSAFRRALSSSALQSHIESESGDGECMP